jgi:hypothetical protein
LGTVSTIAQGRNAEFKRSEHGVNLVGQVWESAVVHCWAESLTALATELKVKPKEIAKKA